jgi:hypothetical protein
MKKFFKKFYFSNNKIKINSYPVQRQPTHSPHPSEQTRSMEQTQPLYQISQIKKNERKDPIQKIEPFKITINTCKICSANIEGYLCIYCNDIQDLHLEEQMIKYI